MLRVTSAQLLQESEAQARLRHLTREDLRLHGIGDRFAGPTSRDPVAVGRVFREDARTRGGRFAEVRLRVDEPLARRVARLDGVLVEKRLLLAADETRRRCLAALEGVAQVRWQEGPGYDRAAVHLLLSARAKGSEATRPLQRADLDRLESVWREESYRVFGLRLRERSLERDSPAYARVEELRQRWVGASREAQRVLHARVWDRAPQEDLSRALLAAASAQGEWLRTREAFDRATAAGWGAPSRIEREVIHIRLEGGRDAFRVLPEAQRAAVLGDALDRVGLEKVRAVMYPIASNDRDLGVSLYYERGAVDRDHLSRVARDHLYPELARVGCRPADGEVRVVLPTPVLPETQPRERQGRAAHDRPTAPEPAWAYGRVYSRNFHLPAEELVRLPPDSQRALVRQAIERQWPELQARGLQASFVLRPLPGDARILRLTILVPEREMEAFRAIARPGGQTGLVGEVERVLAGVRAADLPTADRVAATAPRGRDVQAGGGPTRVLEALAFARTAADSPVRAAARAALDTLARAMPAPFRSAQIFVRQAGAILRREEE
jgi:hypothetical protein